MTKRKILLIFILIFLAFLGLVIFRFKLLTVNRVVIQANQLACADDNQLINSSGLLSQIFFLVDKEKITKDLKDKFICIKNIKMSYLFPAGIMMEVLPREPAALLLTLKGRQATTAAIMSNVATPSAEEINDYLIVDNEGVAFSKAGNGLNIPKIYSFETKVSANVLKILDKVKTLGIDINSVWAIDSYLIINSEFAQDPKLIFVLNDKIDIQIASLQLILSEAKINENELEFIDLRFDKPVVKFAPKKNG